MTDALHLARDREPLALSLRAQELEFNSRGDRVSGILLCPASGAGAYPLVLVAHALGDSAAGVLGALGASGLPDAALAAIDFPLHGARADQKLLRLLQNGNARCVGLAEEFAQQAVIDLERALDALAAAAPIDARRIAYVGFGLGAQIGAAFCALDPRPAAIVLAPGAGGALAAAPDPERYLARIAPRPLLRVTEPPRTAAAAIWAFLRQNLAPRRQPL
jgi:dienelactone hydrolase